MCINGGANGELGHLQGHQNNAFDVSNEDFPRHVERTTCPSFDNITCSVGWSGFDGDDFIRIGAHCRGQKFQSEAPTVNKSISVDACKEARKVLVVNARSGEGVEVRVLEQLDEVEYVPFGQIVREGSEQVVDHFGNTIQHGSEWSREEADDGSSGQEVFLALRENIGVWKVPSRADGPRISFAKLCGNVVDGLLDDVVWAILQLPENEWIGEGLGQALMTGQYMRRDVARLSSLWKTALGNCCLNRIMSL